jgi:hypothetical protein
VFDTTLRDGEQAPGFSMTIDEKLRMARQLEKLNVDILEAGFPIASEGDYEAVRRVSVEVRTPVIAGLALVCLLASLGVPATISIPIALALLLSPGYYHLRRNMVRYTVTDA